MSPLHNLTFLLVLLLTYVSLTHSDQSLLHHNGGSLLAMAGHNSVVIATDKRFGIGPQTVSTLTPRQIFSPHSKILVACTGLDGDIHQLLTELSLSISSHSRSSRYLTPNPRPCLSCQSLSVLLSHLLYRLRGSPYFVESIVAGLEVSYPNPNGEPLLTPYLCAHDVIGAKSYSDTFVCSGAAKNAMMGIAEMLWRPGLSKEELIIVCGNAFQSALERDCMSGDGVVMYLIDTDIGITEIELG